MTSLYIILHFGGQLDKYAPIPKLHKLSAWPVKQTVLAWFSSYIPLCIKCVFTTKSKPVIRTGIENKWLTESGGEKVRLLIRTLDPWIHSCPMEFYWYATEKSHYWNLYGHKCQLTGHGFSQSYRSYYLSKPSNLVKELSRVT